MASILSADAFEKEEIIGEGSFGSVFKGYHRYTRLPVAIKVISLDHASEKDGERLKNEISLLSECSHPHVVSYYGSFLHMSEVWIIMELVGGGSISDHIREEGPIEEKYLVAIIACLVKAMHYLHDLNIVHRDLKSANVLLCTDGNIKLADFGVSTQLENEFDRKYTLVGTPLWMAPEVIDRSSHGTAADIWSLGITCVEMALGNPPYCDLHPMHVLFLIPMRPPPLLSDPFSAELQVDDPVSICSGTVFHSLIYQAFVEDCLQKDPEKRATAERLLEHELVKSAPNFSILTALVNQRQCTQDCRSSSSIALTASSRTSDRTRVSSFPRQSIPGDGKECMLERRQCADASPPHIQADVTQEPELSTSSGPAVHTDHVVDPKVVFPSTPDRPEASTHIGDFSPIIDADPSVSTAAAASEAARGQMQRRTAPVRARDSSWVGLSAAAATTVAPAARRSGLEPLPEPYCGGPGLVTARRAGVRQQLLAVEDADECASPPPPPQEEGRRAFASADGGDSATLDSSDSHRAGNAWRAGPGDVEPGRVLWPIVQRGLAGVVSAAVGGGSDSAASGVVQLPPPAEEEELRRAVGVVEAALAAAGPGTAAKILKDCAEAMRPWPKAAVEGWVGPATPSGEGLRRACAQAVVEAAFGGPCSAAAGENADGNVTRTVAGTPAQAAAGNGRHETLCSPGLARAAVSPAGKARAGGGAGRVRALGRGTAGGDTGGVSEMVGSPLLSPTACRASGMPVRRPATSRTGSPAVGSPSASGAAGAGRWLPAR